MFRSPVANASEWRFQRLALSVPKHKSMRYSDYPLSVVRLSRESNAEVRIPVRGFVRKCAAESGWCALEIETMIISAPELAAAFVSGIPAFYLFVPDELASFEDNQLYQEGELVGSFTECSLGVIFPDRNQADAINTFSQVEAARVAAGLPGTDWTDFANAATAALPPEQCIMLLETSGVTMTEDWDFLWQITGEADQAISYRAAVHEGNLRLAVGSGAGRLSPVFEGETADSLAQHIVWVKKSETDFQVSRGFVDITEDTRQLMVTDLHWWFAPQFDSGTPNPLPRFTRGNRVLPLVNGPEYFQDIFETLNNPGSSGRFFLTGYAINPNDVLRSVNSGDMPATILEAARRMVDEGGQCRFLPLRFLNFDLSAADRVHVFAVAIAVAAVVSSVGGLIYSYAGEKANKGDEINKGLIHGLVPLNMTILAGAFAIAMAYMTEDIAESFVNRPAIQLLNFDNSSSAGRSIAQYAALLSEWEDNPNNTTADMLPIELLVKSILAGVGAFHQKLALVRNDDGWFAWCGGIDLNRDRMDDDHHRATSPYHDVQARVDGPAAHDLAVTFIERWNSQNPLTADQLSMEDSEMPSVAPLDDGTDIVQIARTYFRPKPVTGDERRLSYAPNGDRTLLDTTLAALGRAREYVYIEDQYFTPPPEYQEVLLGLVRNSLIRLLLIIIPNRPDQPYGELERTTFVKALLAANTDKEIVKVGFERRSYVLPPTNITNSWGRLILGKDADIEAEDVELGPLSRIPTPPFWLAINGEIMLATGFATGDPPEEEEEDSHETRIRTRLVKVQRGNETNFVDTEKGPSKRSHKKGNAATVLQFDGIYMHAKLLLIDDVFMSIGSANINRRGYYSDAEANVYSVPEKLRLSTDNPVRRLRKRLWAEMLNLPLSVGQNLLDDPVASARLFERSCFLGNRFIPYGGISEEIVQFLNQKIRGSVEVDVSDFSSFGNVMGFIQDILAITVAADEAAEHESFFFEISDPSSFTQPGPAET